MLQQTRKLKVAPTPAATSVLPPTGITTAPLAASPWGQPFKLWSLLAPLLGLLLPFLAQAGGSGLNVLVVANSASSNSLDLANYFCHLRDVPPQNLLRIPWTGGPINWSLAQFTNTLLNPVLDTLSRRGLAQQVDYVVLSMDFPYRINTPTAQNGTTSALFYGFKTNDPATAGQVCRIAPDGFSQYYGSETRFRDGAPTNTPGYSFLTTLITGPSLAQAQRYLDQGLAGDATHPTNRILLAKTSDPARNVRFRYFDNTVFDARLHGGPPVQHVLLDSFVGLTHLAGLQTGLARFDASPNAFLPGSLADSLTSFGGQLFEASGQTNLLAFLEAGAAGSYGTIAEPCNYLEKFPDPLAYLYQLRGFNLAESYYQSLVAPYQGIVVGDPLSAPFRHPALGQWIDLAPNPTLAGVTNLVLELEAASADRPIDRVDLFLDGRWLQTLTNLPPRPGNSLQVTLNGHPVSYSVPDAATLRSVTADLADLLKAPDVHDLTQIDVYAYGDRLEFQSLPEDRPGAEVTLEATSQPADAPELSVFLRPALPTFLDTIAHGWRSFVLQGIPNPNDTLELTITKTNAATVTVTVTNTPPADSLYALVLTLVQRINANPALTGPDGVFAQDLAGAGDNAVEFNIFARSGGRASSQIHVAWTVPPSFEVRPSASARLDERPNDLRPRNHLYLAAGSARLHLAFPFDTTPLPDGHHELRAVAYEGTAVATQTHFPVAIEIRNTDLEVTLAQLGSQGPIRIGSPAHLHVSAGPADIARIDLFSTGGLLATSTNQSQSTFTLDGTALGAGRHPVYALVTDTSARQVRSRTLLLTFYRHPPLTLTWSGPPQNELSWLAQAGFHYEVLSADSPQSPFQVRDALSSPNGGPLSWTDPDLATPNPPAERFYQVRGLP